MKIKNKKLISFIVLLILTAFALYYIKNNLSEFQNIKIENPYYLLLIPVFSILSILLTSLLNIHLLKPFKVNLKLAESFALSVTTGFYNLITPFRGGMFAHALYLKKKYKFPYSGFAANISAAYIIAFLITSLFGILTSLYLYKTLKVFNLIIFLAFIGIFLISLATTLFSPKLKLTKNNYINKVINVINSWNLIKNNRAVILKTSIINIIQFLIIAILLMLQFKVIGVSLSISAAMFISALSSLSILIAITPGNLGIGEAITIFSASVIGIGIAESLSATLIGRALTILVLFILGPIFSYILIKKN